MSGIVGENIKTDYAELGEQQRDCQIHEGEVKDGQGNIKSYKRLGII